MGRYVTKNIDDLSYGDLIYTEVAGTPYKVFYIGCAKDGRYLVVHKMDNPVIVFEHEGPFYVWSKQ